MRQGDIISLQHVTPFKFQKEATKKPSKKKKWEEGEREEEKVINEVHGSWGGISINHR